MGSKSPIHLETVNSRKRYTAPRQELQQPGTHATVPLAKRCSMKKVTRRENSAGEIALEGCAVLRWPVRGEIRTGFRPDPQDRQTQPYRRGR